MSDTRSQRGGTLGGVLVLVLAPLCCLGLPLLLAAGVSAGAAAAIGGAAVAGVVLALVATLLAVRAWRRARCAVRVSREEALRR